MQIICQSAITTKTTSVEVINTNLINILANALTSNKRNETDETEEPEESRGNQYALNNIKHLLPLKSN